MPTHGGIVTAGKRDGANYLRLYMQYSRLALLLLRVTRGQKSRRANGGKTATGKKKER